MSAAAVNDDDVLELVLGKLDGVRQSGGRWMARCPAHEDARASLSVARGTEQPVVFKCHAGCETTAVLDAWGPQAPVATGRTRRQLTALARRHTPAA